MTEDLDCLLASDLLSVPDDFSERVLREIDRLPQPRPRRSWSERLEWLAVAGTAAIAAIELFSFMFGIWTTTTVY